MTTEDKKEATTTEIIEENTAAPLLKHQANAHNNITMIQPCSTSAKKEKTKKEKEEDKDLEFTWICTECREAECIDDPDAPLIICDGLCNRPFHPPCANLLALPPEDEPWLCGDCIQNRHQCTVCKEYGEDDID